MDILKKITRKRIGSLSFFLLIIYACVVLYFVLFSDRLGRVEGYSTYRYNLIPFVEIRRFILYRDYVSRGGFPAESGGQSAGIFPGGDAGSSVEDEEDRVYPDSDLYIFIYTLY